MSCCSGCYPIYQLNQLAHTEPGGCLACNEEEPDFYLPINLEIKFDAEAKASETSSEGSGFESIGTGTECCICYEIIGKKNNCVTECGHIFCFKCLATAMTHNNSCPYCRTKLIDEPALEDDAGSEYEEDEEEEEEDDDDSVVSEIANKDYIGNVEDIVKIFQAEGITMLDVVSVLLKKFSKTDEKYSNEYVEGLCNKIDSINSDNENESIERDEMGAEDKPAIDSLGGGSVLIMRIGPPRARPFY